MSEILIVGAGPAGLASALALTCHGFGDRVRVVDPSGTWLAAWRRRFAAQGIPILRSPAVHHPHPDPFALLQHAGDHGLVASGGTQLPTTSLFEGFIDHIVEAAGLVDRVEATTLDALDLDERGCPTVQLGNGAEARPDRVVLATNSRHPRIPPPLAEIANDDAVGGAVVAGRGAAARGAAAATVAGPDTASVEATPVGGHVVVIGAGLSAAHLAIGAVRRGAHVTLLARHRLRVRRFDTHPSWLGPKKRRPFEQEPDPFVRRRTIDTARGGGSIPARYHRELLRCHEAGRLDLRERIGLVEAASHRDGCVELVLDDGSIVVADAVWCATGSDVDVTRDELCRSLLERTSVTVAGGLPELGQDLSWPGTSVHHVGFAAGLRLGPMAGNLIGHRRAALRIVAGLLGRDPTRADRIVTGAGACPSVVHGPRA
jgi:hypothetical protein